MTHAMRRPFAMSGFVRFTARFAAVIGVLYALFGLLWSLLGQHVFFRFGSFYIDGIPAGLLGLVIIPVVFTLAGALVGFLIYLPIRLLLWLLWK